MSRAENLELPGSRADKTAAASSPFVSHPFPVLLPQPCSPSSAALLCLITPPSPTPMGCARQPCGSLPCHPSSAAAATYFPFQSRPMLLFPGFCCMLAPCPISHVAPLPFHPSCAAAAAAIVSSFQFHPAVLLFPGSAAMLAPCPISHVAPIPCHPVSVTAIVYSLFSPSQWCCCPKGSAAMLALSISVCPCHKAYVRVPSQPGVLLRAVCVLAARCT